MKLITRHALQRARLRWGVPSDEAADAAIRFVLATGEVEHHPDSITFTSGHRVVRVRGETVVTVIAHPQRVHRPRGPKNPGRTSRGDLRDRRTGKRPKRKGQ